MLPNYKEPSVGANIRGRIKLRFRLKVPFISESVRERPNQDVNPGPVAVEASTVTTRLQGGPGSYSFYDH